MANGFVAWIQEHPDISLAGGAVAVLLIAGQLMKPKAPTSTAPQSDLSGLTNGIVYVPTQTNFETINKAGGSINSPVTTTTTTITRTPPVPPAPPPPSAKGLIWDQHHTMGNHEKLSTLAASLTRTLRAQGMPGGMLLTWADLYGHNSTVIDAVRHAHHDNRPVDANSELFFGVTIVTPRWG